MCQCPDSANRKIYVTYLVVKGLRVVQQVHEMLSSRKTVLSIIIKSAPVRDF